MMPLSIACSCQGCPQGWHAVQALARCGACVVGHLQQHAQPLAQYHSRSRSQQQPKYSQPYSQYSSAAGATPLPPHVQAVHAQQQHCQQAAVSQAAAQEGPQQLLQLQQQQQQQQSAHQPGCLSVSHPAQTFSTLCNTSRSRANHQSSSSTAGLLLHAGSSLHAIWSSSRGSWRSSGSSRCYSSRRGATVTVPSANAAAILDELSKLREGDEAQGGLTPAAVVERLDKVIIAQEDAKKAVAIAFRNRWRRQRVSDPEMRREITPKNLLLIGPTGCGKTEIARRLAKLAEAPFIKVEATKFTEVGYHGRDVDQIIRDLVETSIGLVKKRCKKAAAKIISDAVEQTIISALLGPGSTKEDEDGLRRKYRAGELDSVQVMIDVPQQRSGPEGPGFVVQGGQMSLSVSVAGFMAPGGGPAGGSERRSMPVSEARKILEDVEAEAVLPQELLAKEAVRVAEQEGIVFIDEIDKIVNPSGAIRHGSDPSAEGVQRDLLPLIEGSVITTKHGPVATDHMLFIASGAFTSAKPSDMMAELQGRLPIRVELRGLTADDFKRILTEPDCSMIYQQQRLLGCEGVKLEFTAEAIQEIAALAEQINKEVENIGARRLHTVLERLIEDISFEAPDKVAAAESDLSTPKHDKQPEARKDGTGAEGPRDRRTGVAELQQPLDEKLQGLAELDIFYYEHVIDKQQVREKLQSLLKQDDLSKYIL